MNNQQNQPEIMPSKKLGRGKTIITILVIAILVVLGYYFIPRGSQPSDDSGQGPQITPADEVAEDDNQGSSDFGPVIAEYTHRNNLYSIKFPTSWYYRRFLITDNPVVIEIVSFDAQPLPADPAQSVGKIFVQLLTIPVADFVAGQQELDNFSQQQVSVSGTDAIRTTGIWPGGSLFAGQRQTFVAFEKDGITYTIGTQEASDPQIAAAFEAMLLTFDLR